MRWDVKWGSSCHFQEVWLNGDTSQVSTLNRVSNFPFPMSRMLNFSSGWEPSGLYLGEPRKGKQWVQLTSRRWWPLTAKAGTEGMKQHATNSAILASALPAHSLPSTATVLDWHRSYMIAELCSWPYDSSSARERTWAACKLRVLKRQSLTILALTCVCAYESHNLNGDKLS